MYISFLVNINLELQRLIFLNYKINLQVNLVSYHVTSQRLAALQEVVFAQQR